MPDPALEELHIYVTTGLEENFPCIGLSVIHLPLPCREKLQRQTFIHCWLRWNHSSVRTLLWKLTYPGCSACSQPCYSLIFRRPPRNERSLWVLYGLQQWPISLLRSSLSKSLSYFSHCHSMNKNSVNHSCMDFIWNYCPWSCSSSSYITSSFQIISVYFWYQSSTQPCHLYTLNWLIGFIILAIF